jgi:hypothetical protein
MAWSYFLLKANLLSLRVGPSSPVGKLTSKGRIVHFWTTDALDVALLFALSMPAGELGPTLKLKRFAFNKKYDHAIDRLYS